MINILSIDTTKIINEINRIKGSLATLNKMPYIICSEDTEKLIISECIIFDSPADINNFKNKERISKFCGCKILIDNSLKLGEIDIR